MKYINGERDANELAWVVSNDIPNKGFTVNKNGVYTIYAEDIHGNKSIRRLVIDNFNDNLLPRPIVDNYTNRKQKISGKAEPNTVLIIETPSSIYEQKIYASGKFSVELPGQLAETNIYLYVRDDKRGLESERVPVRINRTGPNQPHINTLYNNEGLLSGNARENATSVIAIIDDTVYVSDQGGRELFEGNKEIYNPIYKIIETFVYVDYDGQFVLMLPPQKKGTSISVYAIDHISRNSRVSKTTVKEAGPNAPVVNEVSNIERTITGYVPSSSNINVELRIGGSTYTTKTDKNGYFSYNIDNQLYAGQPFEVVATDKKNGKERSSYPVEVFVNNIETYVRPNSTNLILNRVTDKSNLISGYYYAGDTVNIAITTGEGKDFSSKIYSATPDDSSFRFTYNLEEKLEVGTKVYVMARFVDGKILLANSFTVTAGRPDMPRLLNDITNTDKEAKVVSIKDSMISLKIGKKEYTTSEYVYDEATDQYIYTLATDRDISGTSISVTAINESGTSDPLLAQVMKISPDSPVVNAVFAGDKTITGSIELLDYVIPREDGIETETKLPKEFKNAPSEVAKTQTRVYAQIGTKKYKGTIDNNGNFTISIPEQSEGTPIKLWGTNKAGRGPLIKVVITKKQ